ncbi:MAG: hypothetical protein AB9895_06505 [Negativicutes bacterium]
MNNPITVKQSFYFDKAVAVNPGNFKVYTAKGIALCFEGDYQAGMAQIQKTLDMNSVMYPLFMIWPWRTNCKMIMIDRYMV